MAASEEQCLLREFVFVMLQVFTINRKGNAEAALQSNVIEITLRQKCSTVHLLYIFRTPFPKNTSGRMLLTTVLPKRNCAIYPLKFLNIIF